MKKSLFWSAALVVCFVAYCLMSGQHASRSFVSEAKAMPPNDACIAPTQMAATPEETAWRLFVSATCPANSDKYPYVVWENWIEQGQLYTSSGNVMSLAMGQRPRFHESPLSVEIKKRFKVKPKARAQLLPQVANQDCNSQTWSGRTICEEARLNPEAAQFVTNNNLTTLKGQEQFIAAGKTFNFSRPSIEVKADWIQLPSCSNPPQGVHVETVGNTCYALGGIHLISKLIDEWVWATFEPQNTATNPQRCVVLGCKDSWGSNPATTSGATTQLTPALSGLMSTAGLADEWKNYRLNGVQVSFVDGHGQPTRLGNSIIEGDNAGNPTIMKSSSCITCHDLSTINAQGKHLPIDFIIGPPKAVPAGYFRRDFVWSFLLAR